MTDRAKKKRTKSEAEVEMLAAFKGPRWHFTKRSSEEIRAFGLCVAGKLERESKVYAIRAGGERVEVRWAYRTLEAK